MGHDEVGESLKHHKGNEEEDETDVKSESPAQAQGRDPSPQPADRWIGSGVNQVREKSEDTPGGKGRDQELEPIEDHSDNKHQEVEARDGIDQPSKETQHGSALAQQGGSP